MDKLALNAQIDGILSKMTLEEKIGHLLHPFVRPQDSREKLNEYFGDIQPGGVFIMPGTREEMAACIDAVQSRSKVPVVISSDLENGAGRMVKDATVFPDLMALGATGSSELAKAMGRAAAIEGREIGIHWTFGPVIDINVNPQNPITNTRSLGDDPAIISKLSIALIQEMQANGLAATAKHFPGDGFDCRDQHICTSINPLSREDWSRLSGRLFRETIEAGVWSIMIGHISLPSVDPGTGTSLSDAPPATLSHRLTTELLRGELGFDGMIVSDASHMGGVTSKGRREDIVPGMLNAGCDQILFCDLHGDFKILLEAYHTGKISLERIDEAVRYVLRLKQRLGLFESVKGRAISNTERASFASASRQVAESAVTLVRDRYQSLPLKLGKGSKVLSYHLRADVLYNVDGIDDLLRETGADVTRRTEEDIHSVPMPKEMASFDLILLNWVYGPSWNSNRIRPNGNYLREIILTLSMQDLRLVSISFGTPYLLHDFPELPALINAYSPDRESQRAALELLQGKLIAKGKSPVRLELERDWFPHNAR